MRKLNIRGEKLVAESRNNGNYIPLLNFKPSLNC